VCERERERCGARRKENVCARDLIACIREEEKDTATHFNTLQHSATL